MKIPFKKDPEEFRQPSLFSRNIFDLLSKDHECFIFDAILSQLDTSEIEKQYSVIGQNAYHPRLIMSILIYSYSNGVFSSREIQRRCNEDIGFMYVSHLNCPNFRVLSDFRKNNYEFFKESFKQSVIIARELGLASLGHVSTDGSKFKANTSKHKAMSYGRLKDKEKQLVKEIEELLSKAKKCDDIEDIEYVKKVVKDIPEELKIKESRLSKIREAKEAIEKREEALNPGKSIDDRKQISFADKEARIMGKKGNFEYSYNGQISVDSDNQIIVGQHLTQNANDKKEVKPALEEIEENTNRLPDKMSLDNGYMSGDNLEALEDNRIDAYVAIGRGEKRDNSSIKYTKRNIKKSDFFYDKVGDFFVCPAGNKLELKTKNSKKKKVYHALKEDCSKCDYKKRCCKSKIGKPRTISTDDKEPLRQEMVEKMEKEISKNQYKIRKKVVEPVFGQIKNIGFRGFHVRGFFKVQGEFSLMCSVHNFKKIVKAITSGIPWKKIQAIRNLQDKTSRNLLFGWKIWAIKIIFLIFILKNSRKLNYQPVLQKM